MITSESKIEAKLKSKGWKRQRRIHPSMPMCPIYSYGAYTLFMWEDRGWELLWGGEKNGAFMAGCVATIEPIPGPDGQKTTVQAIEAAMKEHREAQ